ncbi:GNAT family N-acetyltransferase [Hyunsoonleella pacifica]|uniref:N-acetyltransferase domain-containing protein n=1 Tax=Hyunsoonleella pacifica TaxID=1080224 RepID=A0A4Q9FMD3_9FLAO|nr:GNAT family N-acetyltransferase [Hyunsoonleella pacifica]TBN15377.1 hypothetical protein EYD46_09550 [Hyunsoonleella pacifica]GGD23548.1 hypothetical protein GCM10011368_27020 [Hyunsoonleella pacifica]
MEEILKMDKQPNKTSLFRRYRDIINNGLFLFGVRNKLASIGLNFNPYYWVEEEVSFCEEPKIKDDVDKYLVEFLSVDEFKSLSILHSVDDREKMIKGFEKGQLCVGLKCDNEVAAYTFVEPNDFEYRGRAFKLKPNEVYLFNMWTFHKYRGRGLAPYLRWQTYRLLEEEGMDVKYSITNYFNKSSIKFKNKLNTVNHKLYLGIVLFKKFRWNFTLKHYKRI